MTTASDPSNETNSETPPNPRAGGRRIANPPTLTPERRRLIERAQARLPEDATAKEIASVAIQMAKDERGGTWMELVDSGWTFSADEVRRVLGRDA